ncbi:hypothetical protein CONPUDRAFT_150363 [Coniophora puteana RWD-64-598 SS2]|uniref:Uncharacterized protein n=1 Tax=Coniophora puteana (strain RWD-64-598) TaxID=741705 RepID=A0A5M3N2F2_CONPW|nr:uncharacterized protein CONPUDRAFT_150363 [Coniophora puteana RWD-64-598 SS2]EIW85559.1 hypothetical protein CONPUDRAFT_150363 [Coniophora puteana RWD-64-598 SS2]
MSEQVNDFADTMSDGRYNTHDNRHHDVRNFMASVERTLRRENGNAGIGFEHGWADWFNAQDPRIDLIPASQVRPQGPPGAQNVFDPVGATALEPHTYGPVVHHHPPGFVFRFGPTGVAPAYPRDGRFISQAGGATRPAPLPPQPRVVFAQLQSHAFAPRLPAHVAHVQRLFAQLSALEADIQRLVQHLETVLAEQRWIREQIEARVVTEQRRNAYLRGLWEIHPNNDSEQSENDQDGTDDYEDEDEEEEDN